MGKVYLKNGHFNQISEAKVPILVMNSAKCETSRIIPSVQGNDPPWQERSHSGLHMPVVWSQDK